MKRKLYIGVVLAVGLLVSAPRIVCCATSVRDSFRSLNRPATGLNPIERVIFSLMLAGTEPKKEQALPANKISAAAASLTDEYWARSAGGLPPVAFQRRARPAARPPARRYFFFFAPPPFFAAGADFFAAGAASTSNPAILSFSVSKL